MENRPLSQLIILPLVLAGTLLVGALFLPWQKTNWGKLQLLPGNTVTVLGEAKTNEKNRVASFSAGVNIVNDNKDVAVKEANEKIELLVKSIKDFGIKSEDIKTQNLNIYQNEETYYDTDNRQKSRPGQWRVSNSIEIKLKDSERAQELADLLTKSGATSVYGPNLTLEDTKDIENSLIKEAIEDAKKKAENIATSSERKLGKVLTVTEGFQTGGVYSSLDRGGGGGIEPGTSTVNKTVTVVFELD